MSAVGAARAFVASVSPVSVGVTQIKTLASAFGADHPS
jgi:hypothetical protein